MKALDDLVRPLLPRFSVGIWGILNRGADTFGDPVREVISVEEAIALVGSVGMQHISFHDYDVGTDPWESDPEHISDRVLELNSALSGCEVSCFMYTPKLFGDPMVRAGSVTANSVDVRRASISKILQAIDTASLLGAKWVTFWWGRDGQEVDAMTPATIAFERIVYALRVACWYIKHRGYNLRITLEPKPFEPRDSIYVSTTGTALAIIAMIPEAEYRDMVFVNPELLQHAAMSGLNSYHEMCLAIAAGKLGFPHLGGQNPNHEDQDLPFGAGNSSLKACFYVMLGVHESDKRNREVGTDPIVLEFDNHPFRTEADSYAREEYLLANMEVAAILFDRAGSFLQLASVQSLLDDPPATDLWLGCDPWDDPERFLGLLARHLGQPRVITDEIRPRAQELDMLVMRHLTGLPTS